MSGPAFVDDFAAIAANLSRLESEKRPSVIVTDGDPVQWVDTVYGMYQSKPGDDNSPSEII